MAELNGNLLVAQSGGPTCAINASIAGVITEAGRHECIEEIYGGLNGILGILNEEIVDINDEKAKTIEGLKYTPAAALGTCRYKINFQKKPDQAAKDMDRLFEVFTAHNIRYFFYAGGNDSQDTSHKIHEEAVKRGYELRIIGVPKTIDNDLPHTDSCPGYGSVIKYNATAVMEVGFDVGCMATDEGSCCIIEVMGRSAGWIAAGTVLAKRGNPANPPHIILMPEVPFEEEKFLAKAMTVKDNRDDGLPNFLGPLTHGPTTGRFIYINIGKSAGQFDSCWERRLKIPLDGITWEMIEKASTKMLLEAPVAWDGQGRRAELCDGEAHRGMEGV